MPPKAAPKGKAAGGSKKVKVVQRVSPGVRRKQRKSRFRASFKAAIDNYKNCLVVAIDNVGSNQIQLVRLKLREQESVMYVGKNTVIRPIIRDAVAAGNKKIGKLLPFVKENVAFIFTNSSDLASIRDLVTANKVPAAARTGAIAPSDVHIPAGPTALDPGQTSFFQSLQIATKITKGAIEILNPVHLIKTGLRVSASAVALLAKLNIRPFFYGITVVQVYEEGFTYGGSVLDMDKDDLFTAFVEAVDVLRKLSLATNTVNATTIRNSIIVAHNILLKVVVNIEEYSFASCEDVREALGLKNEERPESGSDAEEGDKKSGSGSGSGSGSSSGSSSGSDSD